MLVENSVEDWLKAYTVLKEMTIQQFLEENIRIPLDHIHVTCGSRPLDITLSFEKNDITRNQLMTIHGKLKGGRVGYNVVQYRTEQGNLVEPSIAHCKEERFLDAPDD